MTGSAKQSKTSTVIASSAKQSIVPNRHSGMVRQHQTSDVPLHIGESRDSGFDASHRPGMTVLDSFVAPSRAEPSYSATGNAASIFRKRRDFQTHLRDLAARFARVLPERSALSIRGRGECRAPDAPAASCAHGVTSMHTSIHSEPPEITRHSRTQWFTAYTALSPVIGFLVTVFCGNLA